MRKYPDSKLEGHVYNPDVAEVGKLFVWDLETGEAKWIERTDWTYTEQQIFNTDAPPAY